MPALTYAYTNYSLPTPTKKMSSTSFRQQVTQLLSDLTRCYELCDAIKSNRRLGSTHESFDRLKDGIKASASEIQLQFNLLRRVIGSKMDEGDDKARSAMEICVHDAQMEIRAKLFDIAYKKRDGRNSPELPGFRDLLRRWRMIEHEVTGTLENLGKRLDDKKNDEEKTDDEKSDDEKTDDEKADGKKSDDKKSVKKTKKEEKKAKKEDKARTYSIQSISDKDKENEEVTIRLKDLDTLLRHMKNCWVEKLVAGEILYVNKFDTGITQWKRPSGYIKKLTRSSRSSTTSSRDSRESRRSSVGSWDLPRKRTVVGDTWYNPSGW